MEVGCLETAKVIAYESEEVPDMKRKFTATVYKEEDWHIAQCLEVDIASQGSTKEESLRNLREALELHLEAPCADILPAVETIEVDISAA